MAKITQLREVLAPTGDEAIPVISDGVTKRVKLLALSNAAVTAATNRAELAAVLAQSASYPSFDTRAKAVAGLAPIANDALLGVMADESQGGARTIYRKVAGALSLVANLSLVPTGTMTSVGAARRWLRVYTDGGDVPFTGYIRNVTNFSGLANPVDDLVAGLGFNASDGGAEDSSKPAFRDAWENAFKNPGDTSTGGYFERHIETIFANGGGTRRHLSIYAPRVLGDGQQRMTFEAGVFAINEHDTRVERFNWNLANGAINIADGQYVLFGSTNQKVLSQLTPAGDSYIGIKLQNALGEMAFEAPIYNGGGTRTNLFGNAAHYTAYFDATSLPDGARLFDLRGTAAAGAYVRPYSFNVDTTGLVETRVRNSLGPVCDSRSAAGGDSWRSDAADAVSFSTGAATDGVWALARGDTLADRLVSVRRGDGVATFAAPLVLKSYTVGTLPTPTAALANAITRATDARNAGQAEGAGTGSLVECTGSIWKIPGIAGAVAA